MLLSAGFLKGLSSSTYPGSFDTLHRAVSSNASGFLFLVTISFAALDVGRLHQSDGVPASWHLPQTADLIASVLTVPTGDTRTDTVGFKDTGSASQERCKGNESKRLHGRPVGTRTPDLYRVKEMKTIDSASLIVNFSLPDGPNFGPKFGPRHSQAGTVNAGS